jgi:cytochrome c oxidase cbb3-type subunit 3
MLTHYRNRKSILAVTLALSALALVNTKAPAQGPPPGPGRAGRGGGGGLTRGPDDQPQVDPAAADRGGTLYLAECVNCHGPKARGGDKGADLVRSQVVLHDRFGSQLGPFLQKGHKLQSDKSASTLSAAQTTDLANFLRQRLLDTFNRSPGNSGNPAPNVLTGDAKAGEAYFNGTGKCNTCHQPGGNLKGIGAKYEPADIQQRFLFPGGGGRGGRGRGPAPVSAAARVTITVTPPSGPAVTGVPDHVDDFNVTLRDNTGAFYSWTRTPALKVEVHDPLVAHVALLPVITDKEIHDVVAYLETQK